MNTNQKLKQIILKTILLLFLITLFLMAYKYNFLVPFVFLMFATIYVFIISAKNKDIKNIVLITFIIRVILAIICCFYSDSDPDGYGLRAYSYTLMPLEEYINNIPLGAYFYAWLVGGIWKITGLSYALIRFINAFLSFLSCIIAYKLTLSITNEKVAKRVLLFCCFFPNLIRFSSPFASREAVFVFFSLLFFYSTYLNYTTHKVKYLIISLICLLLSMILHTIAISYTMIYIYIYIISNLKYKKKLFSNIGAFFLMILLFLVIFRNNIGTSKLSMGGEMDIMERADFFQSASSVGRAAYLQNLHTNNPIITILILPIRVAYFLFSPFIWMCRVFLDLLGLFDGILYLLVCYRIFKNRKYLKENKFIFALTLSSLLFVCIMGLSVSNYGTAIRHRQKIIIPLFIISESCAYYKQIKEES